MSLTPCFTVGSIVRCKTCFDETYSGEVVAFDLSVKMLMLRCPASKGGGDQQTNSKLTIVNLSMCLDIEIVKEVVLPLGEVPPLPDRFNLQMIEERLRHATDYRSAYFQSYHPNASPYGQALFRALVKHFGHNLVMWQDRGNNVDIVVMHEVTIKPPYGAQNVEGKTRQSMMYARNVVENFHNKQQ